MSVFGVFLVRIFPHSDWIRTDTEYLSVFSPNCGKIRIRKTENTDIFHAVLVINTEWNVSFVVSLYHQGNRQMERWKENFIWYIPAGIYLYKVAMETPYQWICSKLTLKTPEWRQSRCSGVLTVIFEQILHIVLLFSCLTLDKKMPSG